MRINTLPDNHNLSIDNHNLSKMRLSIITIALSLILTVFSQGCNDHHCNDHHIIPDFPSDSIDVYVPLKPNEECYSGRRTYGEDSIIGNSIKYRLATDSNNVSVDIDITILELHPRITASLLSFIHRELIDHSFINGSDTIAPFSIKEKTDSGYAQSEIIHMALDWEGENFYNTLPDIFEYGYYNAYKLEIEIDPVFLNDRFITYKIYSYDYTGGAHGNYSTFLQTYDLKTGEPVDLEDIIIPDKLNKIRERVAYHMAAIYSTDS